MATAGKTGVAAGRHSHAGVVGRFRTGAANCKFGADAGRLDDANGMVQFGVALSSTAARIGIKQNGGFAHALASSALSLAHAAVTRAGTNVAGGCFRGQISTILSRKDSRPPR